MNYLYKMLFRFASTYSRKMRKQEELKEIVFQYAGKNIKRTDRVYGWGCSATGALGRKTLLKPEKHQKLRTKQFVPLKIDFFAENDLHPLKIACGYGMSVIICRNKKTDTYCIFASGLNTDSQLGYHEYPRRSGRILDMLIEWSIISLPLNDPNLTKITHVACGRAHTIIATDREGLYTFGNNSHGQCARKIIEGEVYRGSQRIGHVPFNGDEIKQLICGQDHTLILTNSGKVYTCGLGADGQTGLGHYNNVDKLTLVEGEILGKNIIHISSKADTTLAVDESGDVFGWGNSEYNQLGLEVEMQKNTPICLNVKELVGRVLVASAGGSSCALLNEKGNIYTWGFGALGQGPSASTSCVPLLIPPQLFGLNEYTNDQSGPMINDVTGRVAYIECGLHYFAALTNTGDLYTWGKNRHATLGLAHEKDQYFPFKVQVPAEVKSIGCGVDHMIVLCKSFA